MAVFKSTYLSYTWGLHFQSIWWVEISTQHVWGGIKSKHGGKNSFHGVVVMIVLGVGVIRRNIVKYFLFWKWGREFLILCVMSFLTVVVSERIRWEMKISCACIQNDVWKVEKRRAHASQPTFCGIYIPPAFEFLYFTVFVTMSSHRGKIYP